MDVLQSVIRKSMTIYIDPHPERSRDALWRRKIDATSSHVNWSKEGGGQDKNGELFEMAWKFEAGIF